MLLTLVKRRTKCALIVEQLSKHACALAIAAIKALPRTGLLVGLDPTIHPQAFPIRIVKTTDVSAPTAWLDQRSIQSTTRTRDRPKV